MGIGVAPWLLWPRAVCVGALFFGLGAVGHFSADGLLPGPVPLLVLLAMSVLLSAPLLNRPATRTRLIAMLVSGQMLVHLILTVTAGHRGDRTSAGATPAPFLRTAGGPTRTTVDRFRTR